MELLWRNVFCNFIYAAFLQRTRKSSLRMLNGNLVTLLGRRSETAGKGDALLKVGIC